MCFGIICWFIRIWLSFVFEVNVLFIYSLSKTADRIQWPTFRLVHDNLKAFFTALLTELRSTLEIRPKGYLSLHSEENNVEEVRRGNAYVDYLLSIVKGISISKPYKTEDKVIGFNTTVISMNIHGELRISPSIQMCLNFKRTRDCSLQREDGRLRVNASIGGSILPIKAGVEVKFLNFTKLLTVSGSIPYIETYMEFDFDRETLKDGRLTEFILLDMSGMNFSFKGAGPLNFILNFTTNSVIRIFKILVSTTLQKEIQTHLAVLIANFQFPVGDERPSSPEESHSDEQGARPSSPEESHPDEQAAGPSSSEIPLPATLRKERDLSSSSEESDTAETDGPSLEA